MTRLDQSAVLSNEDVAKLVKGAGVSLVGKMAGRAIHVLSQVILARMLGPAAFGLYAIGWTMLRMVGLLSTLGLNMGVIHYAPRYRRTDPAKFKGVVLHSLGLAIFSGLLFGGGLFLAAPWLAEQVFQKPDLMPVIRWFSPAFIVYSGLKVATATTRVSQRMTYAVYAEEVAQPISNLLLILLFYLMGWELFGAVTATVISFAIALVLATYYIKRLFPEVFAPGPGVKSGRIVRDLVTFSIPASLAGVFTMFIVWIDRLMVGYLRPAGEVGIYQAVSQSSVLFAITLSAFHVIFSPMIAQLYYKKEIGRLEELFRVSTKWGLYLSLPMFLVIWFAPREVLTVVFGAQYLSGWLALVILAAGQLVNVGTGAVGLILIMTGHQKRWFLISGTMLFANIVLSLILIPRLGLAGAALGTATVLAGLMISGLLQVRNILGIVPYDRRYFKGLLAAATAAAALLVLRAAPIASPLVGLLLTIIVSSGVFVMTLLLLGLDAEDREFIRLIRARLG